MDRNEAQSILNKGFTHTVKDPLWQNIPLTKELKALTEEKSVQKLARIKQNGPVYHIYPGSVHTRLSHSLGVYYLGREILLSLAKKSEVLPFTETGIMSFLCACLLHDIGHFPYAHSLKELAIREHEEIAGDMICNDSDLRTAVEKTGSSPEMVASIIDKDLLTGDDETLFYRNVLSGTLDPDKLDYLSRDAFFAGIPYGKQDTDFIISSLSFSKGRLCLDKAALSNVEQILFSKYMMYKTLYWHKGVRSATSMIKKAILSAIEDETIKREDLYGLDDNELVLLCKEKKYKTQALELVERVEHNNLFERKIVKDYVENGKIETRCKNIYERKTVENEIYMLLKYKYPFLKPYEVIIDIPEPISFETHISIIDDENNVGDIQDDDMIFNLSVSQHFQNSLRKVGIFTPDYVEKEDIKTLIMGLM